MTIESSRESNVGSGTPTGTALILGATSAIAHEVAKQYAAQGADLFLVGRDQNKLNTIAADLSARGAKHVDTFALDLNHFDRHAELIDTAERTLGRLDAVLIAHGTLGDQQLSQASVNAALHELNTNFISYVSLLTLIANKLEVQKSGTLAVISSVAGDRGRASNYVYGAAKAGVTAFVSGLRARLGKVGVKVVTVKPGFVDTPMTAGMKKNPLYASAASVGKQIHAAMNKSGTGGVLYTPFFWRFIMGIIRTVPESVFSKLKF